MERGVWKSVIDHILFGKAIEVVEMVVEDSGNLDVGSHHNPIWSEVIWRRKEVRRREWYNWRVDGKLDCEEYQEAVKEVFIGWEEGYLRKCGVDREGHNCNGENNRLEEGYREGRVCEEVNCY